MNTRSFQAEGIVIKRKNIGEADRIITVFTKLHGKLQIKAAGVRRITSRRSSHIELLNHARFSLYRGRSLPILTEIETISDYSPIKANLKKVGFAYHVCELIDGLCAENQENNLIFSLLEQTLSQLSLENNIPQLVYNFEITLLKHLGFFPSVQYSQNINTQGFIENILERRLKSKQLLPQFTQ